MNWIFVKKSSVPWTPSNLTTAPLLWLDAQTITGLSDGDTLTSWTASVGTNPTMNGTLTYETSEIGTQPAVMVGNEVGDYLGFSGVTIGSGDSISMYQVAKVYFPNLTTAGFWRDGQTSLFNIVTGNRPWFRTLSAADEFKPTTGFQIPVDGNGTGDPVMMGWVNRSGAGYDFYANGTLEHTATHSATVPSASITTYGYHYATSNRLKHTLGELLFFNYSLSQSDREKLEGYMAHRWGMTADLPAGHPYKTAAPTA